jgi:hypothetical protein
MTKSNGVYYRNCPTAEGAFILRHADVFDRGFPDGINPTRHCNHRSEAHMTKSY